MSPLILYLTAYWMKNEQKIKVQNSPFLASFMSKAVIVT